ncbi:MAG: flagellar hook-length control protein FliK [Lachnospiraceae bacterium]
MRIDMIQVSRPAVEGKNSKALPDNQITDFRQLLKSKEAKTPAAPGCETAARQKNSQVQQAAPEDSELDQEQQVPADAALLLLLGQLLEIDGQLPSADFPATAALNVSGEAVAAPPEMVAAVAIAIPEETKTAEPAAGLPQNELRPADLKQEVKAPLLNEKRSITAELKAGAESLEKAEYTENQTAVVTPAVSGSNTAVDLLFADYEAEKETVVQTLLGRKDSQPNRAETAAAEDAAARMSGSQFHDKLSASGESSVPAQSDLISVKTTAETMPADVGSAIAANMPEDNGMLTVELEPATLGKLTIQVIYEEGRAAVSIISDNPRTLELLSQKAGEMAQILENKTGEQTVVYTPEAQPEMDEHQGGRQNREQGRKPEQNQHQPDSFAQQLRLGLV